MAATPQVKLLKRLIWTYLVLLLLEGALRKWVLPSLATPLLIVRDPLVLVIYLVAASCRRFVVNGYVVGCFLLAITSLLTGLMVDNPDFRVSLIGLRCYFLHLPLIFVMEKTLEEDDIWLMGKFLLWFAIPETVLLLAQFYSSQMAWVNRAIGGEMTQGFAGALDRFRPSGTFSFTTGVAGLYPLVLAALIGFLISRRKLPWYLSIPAGVSVAVAVPFSISRTNALTCALVLLTSGAAMFMVRDAPRALLRTALFSGVVMLIVSWLPRFDEGVKTFDSRWVDSTGQDVNGFRSAIIGRFFGDLIPSSDLIFTDNLLGVGVGRGTNMAQGYLTGQRQFIFGEGEWPRLLVEMGPVLGLSFIILRVMLCMRLIRLSFTALRRQNVLPALFAVEAFFLVLNAQWGQPTTLGFATFSAGLTFAAARITLPVRASAPTVRRNRSAELSPLAAPLPEPHAATPFSRTGSSQ